MESLKGPAEHRIILRNTSWETHERLLDERGDSRVPRLAYDRGALEIISPSSEHQRVAYCPSAEHERVDYYVGLIVARFARGGRVGVYGVGIYHLPAGEDLARGFETDPAFYTRNREQVREARHLGSAEGLAVGVAGSPERPIGVSGS